VLDINENKCIGRVEHYYLKHKRNKIHVAMEDIEDTEWFWSEKEVRKFRRLWKMNMRIDHIAKEMKRSEVAIMFLALDQIHQKNIRARDWNIW
jgi:hypothetical protein